MINMAGKALNDYRKYIVYYLEKPYLEEWEEKLRTAIDAVVVAKHDAIQAAHNDINDSHPETERDYMFILDRGRFLKIQFDRIAYIETAGGGECIIVTDNDKEYNQVNKSLNYFLKNLPPNFVQISRFNIVNIDHIKEVIKSSREVIVNCFNKGKPIKVTEKYYPVFINQLPIDKQNPEPPDENPEPPVFLQNQDIILKKDDVTILQISLDTSYEDENTPVTESYIRELQQCFKNFDTILSQYSATKLLNFNNRYICASELNENEGDKKENDKENAHTSVIKAIEMALDFKNAIKNWNQMSRSNNHFDIRIAIHTGRILIALNDEEETIREGDPFFLPSSSVLNVWGDSLSVVDKIQQHTEANKIYISDITWSKIRNKYFGLFIRELELGNDKKMEMYCLE